MHDAREEQRLQILLKAAGDQAVKEEARFEQTQLELSKERTQYFEKIALGSGATIAATVSFIGTHSGKLQPPWLLRSALVGLVIAIFAAMYRNWCYPYYVLSTINASSMSAMQIRERAKRDYFVAARAQSIQDGKIIDGDAWATAYKPKDIKLTEKIAKTEERSKRAYRMVQIAEFISLLAAATALCLLVLLAWRNF